MTKPPTFSRRSLLTGLLLSVSFPAWAQVRRGNDQGIGGTGISGGQDQGLGGTGIVGVIRRFGSIFVNGEKIGYAADVPVRIDGEAVSVKALRIGHVARVVAMREANGALTTRGIDVVSEVVGPIESVRADEITVLGQRVTSSGKENWRRVGTHVAVSGLRRTDGVIVASLVQQRSGGATRVSGLLERDRDGLRIGGLRVQGVDAALVGQRVQAEGRAARDVMQVARARADDFSDLSGASRLSIEAYVRRVGGNLQLGSGYIARDGSRFEPTGGEARVVVNAVLDSSRALRVESVQSVGRSPGSSVQNPGSPPRTPGSGPGQGPGQGGGPNMPGARPDAPGRTPGPANEPGGSGPGGFGSPGGFPGGPGPGGGFGGGGPGGGGPGGGFGGGGGGRR